MQSAEYIELNGNLKTRQNDINWNLVSWSIYYLVQFHGVRILLAMALITTVKRFLKGALGFKH